MVATLRPTAHRVPAVDQEPAAIARILAAAPEAARPRLGTLVAAFQDVGLPAADFIYAGLSLPFCPPEQLPAVWAGVVAAPRPGGRPEGCDAADRVSL